MCYDSLIQAQTFLISVQTTMIPQFCGTEQIVSVMIKGPSYLTHAPAGDALNTTNIS